MNYFKVTVILSLIYFSTQQLNNPSGNFCSETIERTNYTSTCNCFTLFWCCGFENVTEVYNETEYSCCTGWTHNGDENCSVPICTSLCQNGGQCVNPDTCQCTAGYQGSTCDTVSLCSHLSPCYPGDCSGSPEQCVCSNGFSGSSCLQFNSIHTPILDQSNSSLTYFNTTSNNVAYSYMVHSASNDSVTWSNQKTYNGFQFSLDASFASSAFGTLPMLPGYVKDVTFGIVAGQIIFTYSTLTADSSFTLPCPDVGNSNPVDVLSCYLRVDNTFTVQSGESFTLTFSTTSGGNRRLLNTDDNSITGQEFYSGQSVQNILQFKFDFDVPVHCTQTSACTDNPMSMEEDVTMTAIRPFWSGWSDALASVYRYSFEIWKMEYVVSDDGLRESVITDSNNPEPLFIAEVMADSLIFPQYTPTEPGVYSCILEVNDKANNSEYVRRIVVFDDTSDITVNTSNRLFVSSASVDTNYVWQTDYNLDGITDIIVMWGGVFSNDLHDQNNFLSKVLDYEPRLNDNIWRYNYKRILTEFNDNEGDRTVGAITHIRGIVKYEMVHEIISKPKTEAPESGWLDISPLAETSTFQMASRTIGDGDSHQIWVRASDVRNVNKTETAIIHFDQTGPEIYLTGVQFNINVGGNPFSSSISVVSQDLHSGVRNASFKLVLNQTGEVKYSTEAIIVQETETECSLTPDCYCVPMGNCFMRTIAFNVDNCLLGVPLEFVSSGTYNLQIVSYNTALLSTYTSIQIGNVSSFNGIHEYPSPSSITFVNKTNSAVTIQWTNVNTCYERLRFIIFLYNPDNITRMFEINKDTTVFSISGLSPGDTYNLEMFTEYGNETYVGRSLVPLNITFMTAPYCSHLQPCFPGHCTIDSDVCNCTNGFSGESCLQFDALYTPTLLRYNSTLSFEGSMTGIYLYAYTAGSDEASINNLTWSNQEDFNTLQITFEALFDQTVTLGILPDFPNYIGNISFGIVEGLIQISHVSSTTGINNTFEQCSSVSGIHPVQDLKCFIRNDQAKKFSSGDMLMLTFNATSGGNRELIKINDGALMEVEFYSGPTIQGFLEFRFDFDVPIHCVQTTSCTDSPMVLAEDVTKAAIRPGWSGWTDSLSSVYRYSFEVWKLEYVAEENGLREPLITSSTNPKPLFISELMSNTSSFPAYLPDSAGVYSCILEINDRANNSEYVRRVVIYDNTSDILVNTSQRLIVTSANMLTDYIWQTDFRLKNTTQVILQWEGLFENTLHKDEHFLSKVVEYIPRLSDNVRRHNYKRILPIFDDNEGNRTTSYIPNINGIVKFEINREKVTLPKLEPPHSGWTEILPLAENTTFEIAGGNMDDGDSQQIWIRAFDVMNNFKTENTVVYFDQSGPEHFLSSISYNVDGGDHQFTSRINFTVEDLHSGMLNTSLKIVLNGTGEVRFEMTLNDLNKTFDDCSTNPSCYCIPKGECFVRTFVLDINNCILAVPIDMIDSAMYVLQATSYNTASLMTSTVFQIGNVRNFQGIDQYSSPVNISVVNNKTNSEVVIQWSSVATCYELVRFSILLDHPDNTTVRYDVNKNITMFTFTGLTPGETYNIDMYTEYGNDTDFVRSLEASHLTFTTASFCSHLQPCFPGHCKTYIDECICSNEFTGESCQNFNHQYIPTLQRYNSTLSYRVGNTDMFSYIVNSSANISWSNQENFNILDLNLEAYFDVNTTIGPLPEFPNYIRDVQFGIVEGLFVLNHTTTSTAFNSSTLQCTDVSQLLPVSELQCNIVLINSMDFRSGDRYEMKITVTTGGNRELINIGDGSTAGIQFYNGHSVFDYLEFRFDFDVPVHCYHSSSCNDSPMFVEKDVTMTAIRPVWSGWTDSLSGVYRYSFEVWKLEYIPNDDGLREPLITNSSNPEPLFIIDIPADNLIFPEYQPTEPGVYSCILEVNDKANNSEYVRRIVIYDDTSDITINKSQRLLVASATSHTNYLWQTDYMSDDITNIEVTWLGLFANSLHEQGHFLSKVLDFEPRLSDNIRRHNYKRIPPAFDDNEGERQIDAIPNVNGITSFQVHYESVASQQSHIPLQSWIDVLPIAENTSVQIAANTIENGNTYQVWIRAYDILNNSKIETTIVHFDKSGPDIYLSNVNYDVDGIHMFTSRYTVISRDVHSGVLNTTLQFILNRTNEMKYQTDISNITATTEECSKTSDCYCVPMGDCFMQTFVIEVNNCLLGVQQDLIENGTYILKMVSTNVATLMTTAYLEFNIKDFTGINEYSSPVNVSVVNKTNSEIIIQWSSILTCYNRVRFVVFLHHPDNSTVRYDIDKDISMFTFDGLTPGESYIIDLYTEYGNDTDFVRSLQPSQLTVTTASYCSHLQPCFPGHCKTYIDECLCTNDFVGESCQNFDMKYIPTLRRSNSTLTYKETTTDVYLYTVSSSANITWSNQEDFNMLEFVLEAYFNVNATIGLIPEYPNYIKDVQFGIVEGLIVFNHSSESTGLNSTTLPCKDVSNLLPVAELECNIVLTSHMNLQSGDRYEIKFSVVTGGFRELINIGDGSTAGVEVYNGHSVYAVLEFRFDFDVPNHCIQSSSCTDNPLILEKDVTKTAIRPGLSGWTDILSGVYRYSFEVWKLEYITSENGLREPLITNSSNPEPLFITDISADNLIFPEYLPTEPGVYSCILEVNDKANNSEYVRRIVIFDDTSDITVNTSQRLLVSSAKSQTNYLWQTNYSSDGVTNIEITWNGLFANVLHEQGHFLSKVLDYEPRLSDNIRRHNYKRILPEFDDNEGNRHKSSILNINGIVRFQLNQESVTRQKSQEPSNGWINVSPIAENTSFELAANTIGDGDSHQIWIRAYDILNNSQTETTIVHFDKSGPEIHLSNVNYDVNGQYMFTSRFSLISRDPNSGLLNTTFQLVLNGTSEVKYQANMSISTETTDDCSKTPDCYCVPMGDCFMQTVIFDVNNCLLGVHLDLIENGIYILKISSTNVAMLMTTMNFELNIKEFSGINEYPSPSDIAFGNKSDTEVTIQWTNVPTCYEVLGYVLNLYQPNNSTKTFNIESNLTKFVINNLSPGVTYGLEMFTVYGNDSLSIRSPGPLNVTFDTSEADITAESSGLNLAAIIVPSVIALIILTIIGIVLIRILERKRHRNLSIKPSPEPSDKQPIVLRTPTITRSRTGSLLSIPERPSLDKANSNLRTSIFSINLPKGRANILPPLPPLSSKMNGSIK